MGQYSGAARRSRPTRGSARSSSRASWGFSVALDLPTQIGLDSDDPLAQGEVGRVGVPIDSLRDMVDLLDGIPLDKVRADPHHRQRHRPARGRAVHCRRRGARLPPRPVQRDAAERRAQGVRRPRHLHLPARHGLRFSVDVIEYCARTCRTGSRSSSAATTSATRARTPFRRWRSRWPTGSSTSTASLARGSRHRLTSPIRCSCSCRAHLDLFEEVAKFRAARRMWARADEGPVPRQASRRA